MYAGGRPCARVANLALPLGWDGRAQGRLSIHLHGHVGVAVHVRHEHPPELAGIHGEPWKYVKQAIERDSAFQSRQCSSKTAVDPIAEAEVLRLGTVPIDVEGIGCGKGAFVAIG